MAKPIRIPYTITQGYLERYPDYVIRQFPGINPFHDGIDISAPRGTPVFAVKEGRVVVVDHTNDANGLGIVIDHGSGEETIYWHSDVIYVSKGQLVTTDTIIGNVGSSGFATGPHLHFGRRLNGKMADPGIYLGDAPAAPWPPAPAFNKGQVVTSRVNDLRVRQGSGITYPIAGKMNIGTIGRIKDGPRVAGGYHWYDVDFTAFGGGTGWVAGEFLVIYEEPKIIESLPTPPPPPAEQVNPPQPAIEPVTPVIETIIIVPTIPTPIDTPVIQIPTESEVINMEKNTWSSFLASLRSRKFILAAVSAGVAGGNAFFGWGLTVEQVLLIISPLLTFIGVEGYGDAKEREAIATQPSPEVKVTNVNK